MKLLSLVDILTITACVELATAVKIAASHSQVHTSGCTRDNCLRAMIARKTAATPFCPGFMASTATATTSLGPWATQCKMNHSRISSACKCMFPPTPT
ncbi:hypothetical protein TWF694_006365 [Orbilia ellipsospora]|uniref:Secreted protein n=1 Tax=Orbilia ellipsospora TaxID=2528407 RepID=A0AAV9XK05_9PEZI